jgi:hypothetical protein
MSTINGLTGPRVPPATTSAARETPRTSFLSRVQAGSAGAVPQSPAGPLVSGRDIVSRALSAARSPGSSSTGTSNQGMEGLTEDQQKQLRTVQEMSRSFLMGTMQSIFQGFGQLATSTPQQD